MLFAIVTGMATSTGYLQAQTASSKVVVQNKKNILKSEENPKVIEKNGTAICFANGHPVTVFQEGEWMVVKATDTNDTLHFKTLGAIFGGALAKEAAASSITLQSGTVGDIYGGGYGFKNDDGSINYGDVTGKTAINIEGGTVSNLLVAGGQYYARSREAEINVKNNVSVAYLFCGGYDEGKTGNTLETAFDDSNNRVLKTTVKMTGGTITGYIGCGGGQGRTYSQTTDVMLDGVSVANLYGIASNGRSDNITMKATSCTFTGEIASLNRGRVENLSMTFDKCTFNSVKGYLGAVAGWNNSDSGTSEAIPSVTGSVVYTFTNSTNNSATPVMQAGQGLDGANLTLTGAQAKITDFDRKSTDTKITIKEFTLNSGKTWNFNDGLSIESGCTLTNNGTLAYSGTFSNSGTFTSNGKLTALVSDAAELTAALTAKADTVKLSAGADIALSGLLKIVEPVVIVSADKTQKASLTGQIVIEKEGVTLDNLKLVGNSIGTNYWQKDIVTVIASSVTVTNCEFTGGVSADTYCSNGLVLHPTSETPAFTVKDNVFKGFSFTVQNWASTAFMLQDNCTIKKDDSSSTVTISNAKNINDAELAKANSYSEDCMICYLRINAGGYTYAYGTTVDNALNGLIGMMNKGGVVQAPDVKYMDFIKGMNAKTDEGETAPDFTNSNIAIECKDGVIITKESLADAYLQAGKNVQLLSLTDNIYGIASYTMVIPEIVNLPDSVAFGTAPIELMANVSGVTYAIKEGSETGVVALSSDGKNTLTILKPGKVTLTITKKDKSYDQDLKVVPKTIQVNSAWLTVTSDLTYGVTNKTVTVTVASTKPEDVTDDLFIGLVKDHTTLTLTTAGELTSLNAGDSIPVIVTPTLSGDHKDYYRVATISGVAAQIKKKELTVTAEAKSRNYGVENPEFTATFSNFADSESQSVLGGELKFKCAATKDSKAGEYDITPYGYTSQNYDLKYAAAKLTVTAVAPKVELISAVVGADKKSIVLTGKMVNDGGAAESTTFKGDFTVGGKAKDLALTIDEKSQFTTTLTELEDGDYEIKAKVGEGLSEKLTVTIAAAKTPQTLSFTSQISKLEFGSADIQLAATSDQAAAKNEYKYAVTTGDAVTVSETGLLKIAKAGTATITVSSEGDDNYAKASAVQTIEVTKKLVKVVNNPKVAITKSYDGLLSITLPDNALQVVDLNGKVIAGVTLAESLTAKFENKNASDAAQNIVLSGLALTDGDNGKSNYELTGYQVSGTITKAPLTLTIENAKRKYNELRASYDLKFEGFKNGEDINTTQDLYTGTLAVEENKGVLSIAKGISFNNYELETVPADVEIVRGTPKVVTYSDASNAYGIIVDVAGWDLDENAVKIMNENQAYVEYGDGQRAYGDALQSKAAIEITVGSTTEPTTKAANANVTRTPLTYGQTLKITYPSTATLTSTNYNVLSITDAGADGSDTKTATVQAVGIGDAAIVATGASGAGANLVQASVGARVITVIGTGFDKVYDGTLTANGTLATKNIVDGDEVILDLSGVSFTYADKNAGKHAISPSRTIGLSGVKAGNYDLTIEGLSGTISQKELTVTEVYKAYNGLKVDKALTTYASTGLVEGDIEPLNVDWSDAVNAQEKEYTVTATATSGNYTVKTGGTINGFISKSKILATIGNVYGTTESTIKSNVIKGNFYKLASSGEAISMNGLGYDPTVTLDKAASKFFVSGGDTQNYEVIYTSNSGTYKSQPSGGGTTTTVSVESVSLDKAELTLPRLGTYTLKATVNPSDASNKNVTWKSSDDKIATVDANGKVTAVAVGKATITVTTEDGGKTATCEVTVDFATGLEEAIANTAVYGKDGYIHIQPVAPMQAWVVNIAGTVVYHATISSATQIPVSTGIYLVKLGTGNESVVTKVSVR
ncbi:hypothetical protein DWU89_18705 [Parabacteroides acidifaciens]|nr:hypothetical protein DWU89_18705 [Parabacteroides acidifaciens]